MTVVARVNQSSRSYYKRFHEYYMEHMPVEYERTQVAIQHRWSSIHRAMSKFCSFKAVIDHRNESGKSEQDRVNI
jgi:hypothetical protein